MLADMKDSANNKINSEEISDLKLRIYDNNTAVATTRTLMTESSAANTAPRPSSAPILLSARMVCGKKSQAIVPQSSRKADPIDVRCQRRSFSPKKGENWGSAGMLPRLLPRKGFVTPYAIDK
jgi:hypothetical protein